MAASAAGFRSENTTALTTLVLVENGYEISSIWPAMRERALRPLLNELELRHSGRPVRRCSARDPRTN